MASYTFRFPADLAGADVTVTDVRGGTVTSGTLDGAATFTTTLPEGTYTGVAKRGSHSFSTAADGTSADPDDTEFARQINNPASQARAALSATYAARELDWTGVPISANSSLIDLQHDYSTGYLTHLHSGPSMTGGYLSALGIGDGGTTSAGAQLISQKATSTGSAVRWTNAVGTTGRLLHVTHQSTTLASNYPALYLETTNSTGVASPIIGLVANGSPGAGQKMFTVDTAALAGRAGSMGTTVFQIYADTGDVVARGGSMRLNGATLDVVQADSGENFTQRSRMQVTVASDDVSHVYYRWSGSTSQWFANRIATNAGGGTTELAIQNGTGAAAVGGHTFVSAIRTKAVSGAAGLGFFGTAPIARPTATPAAAVDAATTQTLVNDLRTKLVALGLIA